MARWGSHYGLSPLQQHGAASVPERARLEGALKITQSNHPAEQDHPEDVVQDGNLVAFEYLQGRRLHNLCGHTSEKDTPQPLWTTCPSAVFPLCVSLLAPTGEGHPGGCAGPRGGLGATGLYGHRLAPQPRPGQGQGGRRARHLPWGTWHGTARRGSGRPGEAAASLCRAAHSGLSRAEPCPRGRCGSRSGAAFCSSSKCRGKEGGKGRRRRRSRLGEAGPLPPLSWEPAASRGKLQSRGGAERRGAGHGVAAAPCCVLAPPCRQSPRGLRPKLRDRSGPGGTMRGAPAAGLLPLLLGLRLLLGGGAEAQYSSDLCNWKGR